ncbi:MAG: ABC transporter permease subunit [Actinomycetota bacterium]|nr:ABC transporter permease subunit [Actinomycetota bacterium]
MIRRHPGLLLLPALVPTLLLLGAAVVTLGLQSLGLMPLVGAPRLSAEAFRSVTPDLATSVGLTLAIASAATALAAVVGLGTALLVTSSARSARVLGLAAAATVPIPHLVAAAAVGLLLADSGVLPRMLGLSAEQWPDLVAGPWWVAVVLEYAWKESAFVALVVGAALATRVARYDETAALLGAGRVHRLRHVTLPLAAPALLVASTISFVYVVGSYEVAWLLGRTYPEPLPVLAFRLFSSADLAARPEAAAVSVVTGLVAALVAVASLLLARWREQVRA